MNRQYDGSRMPASGTGRGRRRVVVCVCVWVYSMSSGARTYRDDARGEDGAVIKVFLGVCIQYVM